MLRKSDIANEIVFLEQSIQNIEKELESLNKKVPEGAKLHSFRHRNKYQYFVRTNSTDVNGKYLKAKDRKQAIMLAQIEYYEKLLEGLEAAISELDQLAIFCADSVFESIINSLSPGKRELVSPPYVSDEVFISKWKNTEFEHLEFKPDYPEYYTRQNLRVRSKSEMIIADILDEAGIPFLYEKPIHLKTGTVHPDFTLLNIKTRKELYWEHLGMMDDIDYRNNAFLKLRNYEANGLYPYDSVIWTFETGKYPLNTREIRKMVKKLKCSLGYDSE
jgi:hypothetical protein